MRPFHRRWRGEARRDCRVRRSLRFGAPERSSWLGRYRRVRIDQSRIGRSMPIPSSLISDAIAEPQQSFARSLRLVAPRRTRGECARARTRATTRPDLRLMGRGPANLPSRSRCPRPVDSDACRADPPEKRRDLATRRPFGSTQIRGRPAQSLPAAQTRQYSGATSQSCLQR